LFVRTSDGKISSMYARDVDGSLATSPSFEAHATLPSDAIFTGWRDGNRQLWTDTTTVSIYIVSPNGVERWGKAPGCV
jgi:hypothetical protein